MPTQHQARPADPCALVIFGATGDLTKRLVVPALYNLSRSKVLPEQFAMIGVGRSDGTTDSWRPAPSCRIKPQKMLPNNIR